jgi:hypothetical protein
LPLPPPETAPTQRRRAIGWPRRRLVPVLLPISLALNAILIALAVSDATVASQSTAPQGALDAEAPVKANGAASALRPRSAGVERKLLNLVVQAPAGKLPRELIDSKTGLAKNNLQAVCRRQSELRSFLCVVQPSTHKPGEGLSVRYRLNRKGNGGTFTWNHYRNG